MSDFAVSEHRNETFTNVVRKLFSRHTKSSPPEEIASSQHLLSLFPNHSASIKGLVEDSMKVRCSILTLGKRYKD